MSDMPGPNETRLNLIDGVEYFTLRADDFRSIMRERDELRAENERLRAEVDMWHRHYAGLLNEAHDEIERLRAAIVEVWDEVLRHFDESDLFRKRVARIVEPLLDNAKE